MGDGTAIEWTDATWNPVRGCSRVSEGCRHCYAEAVAARFSGPGQAYEGLARRRANGEPQWTGKVVLVRDHLEDPVRWKRPRRIFVNSMSDLFHEELPFEAIAEVFAVMVRAPWHIYQVLTKRPARMLEFMRWLEAEDAKVGGNLRDDGPWPAPQIWLGVSVEDQETANARIPLLLQTPAAVRFISAEPLLGPVDLTRVIHPLHPSVVIDVTSGAFMITDEAGDDDFGTCQHLDWVIIGGESGPDARPFDLTWGRSLVGQCTSAGVACFFKQAGTFVTSANSEDWIGHPGHEASTGNGLERRWRIVLRDRKGGDPAEWPKDLRVRALPKVA